ncbi:MAG: DegT/DnrJ/EryC1/StrS aminotransferase [Thermoprotei archaeon]|nr:MAG: DegT/DnrJ/EryC1/StrS aminotransferase [Thermoprotei archaeon]
MGEKLAIEGGKSVRASPYEVLPIIEEDEIEAVVEVLRSRKLTMLKGNKVKEFEEAFARYHGVKHAIAVSSGTAALHVALKALGIGPGDEVIVPPFTFVATATAVLHSNAIPVFADIDPKTYNLDPKSIEDRITDRTKAIIVVHLFGCPADMDPIMKIANEYNLYVVEDCAQAIGAEYRGRKVGTIGDVGCFSFYQSKNMMTGEGGMIITNDDGIAEKCRLVRHHGEPAWYHYILLGYNYRMTEMQAALGIVQLKKLERFNEIRRRNAMKYTELLKDIEGLILPEEPPYGKHVWHLYEVLLDLGMFKVDRDQFVKAVAAENVPVGIAYPSVLYLEPLFQRFMGHGKGCPWRCPLYRGEVKYYKGLCPVAEYVAERCFTLRTDPSMTEDIIEDTVKAIRKVVNAYKRP